MNRRNEILQKVGEVTSIPTYVAKAINELQKEDVDLSAVIQIIEVDASITANILKLVNSSAFAATSPITSLHEASVRLGAYNLLEMIIGSSVSGPMRRALPGYDLPPGELWTSSVACAVFSEVIIQKLNLDVPSYTFTAALLRDLGKIVLGSYLEVDVDTIVNYSTQTNRSFPEAEYDLLGIDHAEIGAFLLRRWKLPEELCTPVRWHHRPEEVTEDFMVTYVVHIADVMTCMSGYGAGNDGLKYSISEHVVREMGLTGEIVESIMFEGMTRLADMRDLLEI